jgi:hypothetical protein
MHAMTGRIAPAEVRRRRDHLHRLSQLRRRALYQSMVGREPRVLFERPVPDGTSGGFSDEYVRVTVPPKERSPMRCCSSA